MTAPLDVLCDLWQQLGPAAYRRAMAAACWEAGDLSYFLHDVQLRAISTCREAMGRGVRRGLWNIARRVGKSRGAVTWCAEQCLAGRVRIPYAGMTEGTVRGFIEPHLLELIADAPDHLRPESHLQDWIFPSTGARIVMRGCEDRRKADRLRGPSAHFCVIDEAGFIPELPYVVRDVMLPQLLTTDGFMLLASSPPASPEHPLRTFAIEAEERGAYYHATVYDAPHLDRAAIERAMVEAGGAQSDTWRREFEARWVVDRNRAVFPEFEDLEERLVGELPRPDHFDPYVVGDLGYSDLTVILFAYYHFERALIVVEDEAVLRRPTSDDIHRTVYQREQSLWPGKTPTRAVDARGITLADLRRLQPDLTRDPEGDPAAWHAVANDELEAACNALRLSMTRQRVLIHPRCTVLRAHLRGAVWNTARTSFARVDTTDGGHHFDAAAAAIYLNRHVRVNKNPAPSLLDSVSVENTWVHFDRLKEKDPAEQRRKAFTGRRMTRR